MNKNHQEALTVKSGWIHAASELAPQECRLGKMCQMRLISPRSHFLQVLQTTCNIKFTAAHFRNGAVNLRPTFASHLTRL
jgi:hypothetical protein